MWLPAGAHGTSQLELVSSRSEYNTACYDDPDDTFSTISGSLSKPMPDLPDGDWSIVLKRDIFQKVSTALVIACC